MGQTHGMTADSRVQRIQCAIVNVVFDSQAINKRQSRLDSIQPLYGEGR
jgi:hypothetical protein